ncbi:MAG TPA: hypothetical protein VFJ06_02265 [Halococcus sp.]|nr:hypothetical protein [Halococcus sp.]
MEDIDLDDVLDGSGNELRTKLPGVEVTTRLSDVDTEELEAIHQRQLDEALARAEEAKEATRM